MKKTKDKQPKEIEFPKLHIPDGYNKIFHCTRRIKARYWLLILTALLLVFIAILPHHLLKSLWNGLVAQKGLVAMLLVFAVISVTLAWSFGQRVDVWVFMFLNKHGNRPSWLDKVMLYFTQLGHGAVAIGIAFLMFLGVNHMLAYELIIGSLTLWIIVSFIKALTRRERPFANLPGIRIVGVREKGNSFPSGHTSQAFFTATLFAGYFNIGAFMITSLYILALLVGITRIYVGMHYPRDVFAGALLGTAWSIIGVVVNTAIFG